MINQTLPTNISIHKHSTFGVRLKSAREALGMDRKEVAAQLRLHEQVIIMIESGEFKTDLPLTFIRGYIRNYSKLMDMPEQELKEALEFIKPKPDIAENEQTPLPATAQVTASGPASTTKRSMPIHIGNFSMQLFTYLLALTLIGLVGVWWNTHKSTTRPDDMLPEVTVQTASAVNASQTASAHSPDNANPGPLLPNAENPDALTPPNANDTAAADTTAETVQTPVETKTTTPAVAAPAVKAAAPSVQTPSIFNRGDKASLTQLVIVDRTIQILTSLIMFLIIITASMRLYAVYPVNSIMAGARLNRMPRHSSPAFNFGSIFKLANKFKMNKLMQLSILLMIVISIIGFGGVWWYKHSQTQPAIAAVTPPDTIAKTQVSEVVQPKDNLQLYADLETLAPSPNLNSVLMAGIKIYALQTMVNQLDDYIAQADAAKFALTDKSTPIGQFISKKKPRKHRAPHENNINNNYNNNNNNNNNTVPPYYYNRANSVIGD